MRVSRVSLVWAMAVLTAVLLVLTGTRTLMMIDFEAARAPHVITLQSLPRTPPTPPPAPEWPSSASTATTLPAPIFNNSFFVWGARITNLLLASEEEEEDPSYAVELLVQGDFFVRTKRDVVFRNGLGDEILPTSSFDALDLWCRVRTRRQQQHTTLTTTTTTPFSPMKWRSNWNIDPSAAFFMQRFLCPVALPSTHVHQEAVVLEVEVAYRRRRPPSESASVWFEIPRHTDSIGLAGPNNTLSTPLYAQRRVKYMLCSGGVQASGLHIVPEFLQHHLRLGFQHFMIGIDDDQDATLWNKTYALLRPLVDEGVVVLYTFHTPSKYIESINKGDMSKNVFNEACLSYAKGRAEYMANWDLDEFWMPNLLLQPSVLHSSLRWRTTSKSILEQQLDEYVSPVACEDWCYVSFPSTSIRDRAVGTRPVQQVAREITMRPADTDYTWRKSIARTKNTFNTGPHTFGSCLVNGQHKEEEEETDGKANGCGAKAPQLGEMHHFHSLFRAPRRHKSGAVHPILLPDEYSQWTLSLPSFAVNVTSLVTEGKRFVFNRVPGEEFEPPMVVDDRFKF